MNQKVLTKAEEQVMQTLWRVQKGGLSEIREAMPTPKPHISTVSTLLKILTDKDFVRVEAYGRTHIYSPAINKELYSSQRITSIVRSYFDGSFENVISAMVKNQHVSIADLELLIEQLKTGDIPLPPSKGGLIPETK
jgi:predicted transcriptional regulator